MGNNAESVSASSALPPPLAIDRGVAGASARREAERRRARGGSSRGAANFDKGADGEERLANRFGRKLPGVEILNDRSEPGPGNRNIDHVLIAESGVWVVDAKNHTGRIELRDKGTLFRADPRLYVKGRDQTKLVQKMGWQVDVVKEVLEPMGFDWVPVRPVLCFTDSEWPLVFARPFTIDGVLIGWARVIERRIRRREAVLDTDAIRTITTELSARLPAA